jgi:hypothetical protein
MLYVEYPSTLSPETLPAGACGQGGAKMPVEMPRLAPYTAHGSAATRLAAYMARPFVLCFILVENWVIS